MISIKHVLVATTLAVLPVVVQADVGVPSFFSDDMVLQQGQPLPVWGWAEPGEPVTVEFKDQKVATQAKQDGKWRIDLKPMPASANPVTMKISGKNRLEINNVLVGEVWLCAGGTNMEAWPTYKSTRIRHHDQEVAAAKYPEIRFFTVPHAATLVPQDNCGGKWRPVSPDSVKECSATAYFFARHLRHGLKGVPIGVMVAAWEDSRIEAWTSYDGFSSQPEFTDIVEVRKKWAASLDQTKVDYEKALADWQRQDLARQPESGNGCEKPGFNDQAWKPVKVPSLWSQDAELKSLDQVAVWYRRTIGIPASWKDVAGNLVLETGVIDDEDVTFVNGQEVGRNESYVARRSYKVPESAWGINRQAITLAIRIFDLNGESGFMSQPGMQKIYPEGKSQLAIALAGDWRRSGPVKLAKRIPAPAYPALLQPVDPAKNPIAVLHNGMIQPLVPFGIRGIVWFQGETNRFNAESYRLGFPALVADWRGRWGRELPVYYAQIAPCNYGDDFSTEEFQEVQTEMLKAVPNCGMACLVDVGDLQALAFTDKQEAGRRLALLALAKTYGQAGVACSGPTPADLQIKDGKAYIRFKDADGVLIVHGKELAGFSIAGADGVYAPALTRLEGEAIVVWNDQVANPVKVRYGGADYAGKLNLTSAAGLPTPPFTISTSGN